MTLAQALGPHSSTTASDAVPAAGSSSSLRPATGRRPVGTTAGKLARERWPAGRPELEPDDRRRSVCAGGHRAGTITFFGSHAAAAAATQAMAPGAVSTRVRPRVHLPVALRRGGAGRRGCATANCGGVGRAGSCLRATREQFLFHDPAWRSHCDRQAGRWRGWNAPTPPDPPSYPAAVQTVARPGAGAAAELPRDRRADLVVGRVRVAVAAKTVHDRLAVISARQVPQLDVSQPQCVPVRPSSSRRRWTSSRRGSTSRVYSSPLTDTVISTG